MSLVNGIKVVQSRSYIVGSIDSEGYFSISSRPMPHLSKESAQSECNRLATSTPGKAYVVMHLAGGAYLPSVVTPGQF